MSDLALQIQAIVVHCNTGAHRLRIQELFWDENGNNVDHLYERKVTPEDIEDIALGIEGAPPCYLMQKDGDYYVLSGETGGGRLLLVV